MGVVIYAASRFTNKKNTVANKIDSNLLETMFKQIEEIKKREQKKSWKNANGVFFLSKTIDHLRYSIFIVIELYKV